MPRRKRDTDAGIFHVWTHSVWAAELFRDDVDRVVFLRELAAVVSRERWSCLAFCVMTNHFHLILEVGEDTLPRGMQTLNSRYAAGFNARHRMRGAVFAGRYKERRIESDADLVTTVRYVARNPVEAGMCEKPSAWPWSSYAGTIGAAEPHSFVDSGRLLSMMGGPRETAIARLRAFVETRWESHADAWGLTRV